MPTPSLLCVLTMADVPNTCSALAHQLNQANFVYAIVGGAACQLYGSRRVTEDVDIVVLPNTTASARKAIAQDPTFTVERRTKHTTRHGIRIDILSPPVMWQSNFDATTMTLEIPCVGGIKARVLHPLLLLNNKCGSISNRSGAEKKDSDYIDIVFLLRYCVRNGIRPTAGSVPNAGNHRGEYLMQERGDEDAWLTAGYDKRLGESRFTVQSALITAGSFPED